MLMNFLNNIDTGMYDTQLIASVITIAILMNWRLKND